MNQNLDEAIQLLHAGGVLTRLKDEAQSEREAERAGILVRLAAVEKDHAEAGATTEKTRQSLANHIASLEASLALARRELAAVKPLHPATLDKLRNNLRKLADPAISKAIDELTALSRKASDSFSFAERRIKTLKGVEHHTGSNAIEIAEVTAAVRSAQAELEAMLVAARPDDLDSVIAAKLNPIRLAVRSLHGFN